ncbi:MAG TPA: hypothetical protein VKF36_14310 [Syntrophorhabdales bacterium]|nr:hypothetical protein [Syntrophorhabdales bacterium]
METGQGGVETEREYHAAVVDALEREAKAFKCIEGWFVWVGIVWSIALLVFGLVYLLETLDGGFSFAALGPLVKLLIVLVFAFLTWVMRDKIMHALDTWEQPLLKREHDEKDDEKAREAFRRGARIFKYGVECEVWNDQFVPKPGGEILNYDIPSDVWNAYDAYYDQVQKELAAQDREMWQKLHESLNNLKSVKKPGRWTRWKERRLSTRKSNGSATTPE